jgi:hypothetical protein
MPVQSHSEKIYGWLLHLYPKGYRQEYGTPMLQLFRDQWRDAQGAGHATALVQFWMHTVLDVAATAAAENLAALGRSKMRKTINDLRVPNSSARLAMAIIVAIALVAASIFLRRGLLELGQPLWVAVLAVVSTMLLASVIIGYVMQARIGFYLAAALFIGVQILPLFLVSDPTRWFNVNPPTAWMIVLLGLYNQKTSTLWLLLGGVILGVIGVFAGLLSAGT